MNELKFLDYLQTKRNRLYDRFWAFITHLGDGGIVWMPLIAYYLITPNKRIRGVMLLITLSVNLMICNGLLKNLISRVRPCDRNTEIKLLIKRPVDLSFPSGHTSSCVAMTTTLIIMGESSLIIPAIIITSLIAFSRMYLYVHYPSDILGGIIAGLIASYISTNYIWTRW